MEAGGRGPGLGDNAATLATGRPGVLHGTYTMLLQDEDGQIQETHSVSAGLDYPGVGPEHALLREIGRVQYIMALRRRCAGLRGGVRHLRRRAAGHRIRACAGGRARTGRSAIRASASWSAFPAAVTRTCLHCRDHLAGEARRCSA